MSTDRKEQETKELNNCEMALILFKKKKKKNFVGVFA